MVKRCTINGWHIQPQKICFCFVAGSEDWKDIGENCAYLKGKTTDINQQKTRWPSSPFQLYNSYEHLNRIKDQETMVHLLGKHIQNELVQLPAGAIKQKIYTHANSAKYYSIILDCTPDVKSYWQYIMLMYFQLYTFILWSDIASRSWRLLPTAQLLPFIPYQSVQLISPWDCP